MRFRVVREVQVLRNKTNNGSYLKSQEDNQATSNPPAVNRGGLIEFSTISQLLPVGSYDECCNSRVTAGEVTGTNQTRSDKGTFRQVLGFSSIGHEPGVAGGCRCCESSYAAEISLERERVFGVDSLYRRPVYEGASENIVDQDSITRNTDTGVPKEQPRAVSEENIDPGFTKDQLQRICCQGNNSQASESKPGKSHQSSGSRVQNLGVHSISLTQPKPIKGACC